jgi:hypothetical protein
MSRVRSREVACSEAVDDADRIHPRSMAVRLNLLTKL